MMDLRLEVLFGGCWAFRCPGAARISLLSFDVIIDLRVR